MIQRLPHWLKKKKIYNEEVHHTKSLLRRKGIHTVCESARCPNINECFSRPTATFMILGETCTRRCGFCAVQKGTPTELNEEEPEKIAEAVKEIGLNYVVITSVTRDDLEDGGSGQFVRVVHALKRLNKKLVIEVLTPDFKGSEKAIRSVAESRPDIYNHNVETIPRLYENVRPYANYNKSLKIFDIVKSTTPGIFTKSGLMLGLGETGEEVTEVIRDLHIAGCDILTIGQYLRPTKKNLPVVEYVKPDTFTFYRKDAESIGFKWVEASPFVRSSYNADITYKNVTC